MEAARPPLRFLPHEIYHARPAATEGPRRNLMRTAPHEFYDGTVPPSPPERFMWPHEIYHARPAATEGPRRNLMRSAPHEFYDGTIPARRQDDERVDDDMDSAPPSFTAWLMSGGLGRGVPASASAVAGLPETTVGAGGEGRGDESCAVCLEEYAAGDALRTMPCAHAFHQGCIVEWLAVSTSCPLCRFKLPSQAEEDAAAAQNQPAARQG